jgi:predicted dehydrogenase
MPEPIKVAVVGAGYTAREHVKAFRDCPGVTVSGVFSRGREQADTLARDFDIAHVCESVDELYQRTRADLVVVTVVELAMNAVATACFAHPWMVLTEKPAGYDLADALAIQAAARAKDRQVFVGLNRRCLSATLAVRGELAAAPGERFIKVQDQQNQARAREAGQPPLVVENWMYANAIHTIDYARLLGRGAVSSVERVLPYRPDAPGPVLAVIRFDSGDVAVYEGIWHGPGPWAVSVTVPGRRWELRPLEQAAAQALGEPPRTLAVNPWDTAFKPGFRRQADLVTGVLRGEPAPSDRSLATLDDAVETMRLISRIFVTSAGKD